MPTAINITIWLALLVIAFVAFAIPWTKYVTGKMERRFANVNAKLQRQDARICTLEKEKHESDIKHNALEGCYRALVARFDAAIEHIKELYQALKREGITPPAPPAELELDEDMKANGHVETNNTNQWRDFL